MLNVRQITYVSNVLWKLEERTKLVVNTIITQDNTVIAEKYEQSIKRRIEDKTEVQKVWDGTFRISYFCQLFGRLHLNKAPTEVV